MTFASVAALRRQPDLAKTWLPKITARSYDPRNIRAEEKSGLTVGMAMTEKQGGSDVRANKTRAIPQADGSYELVGHKYFVSAPMCDLFLVLAQAPGGLTCFLLPRWRPDASRIRWAIAPMPPPRPSCAARWPGGSARRAGACRPFLKWWR
jgi:putative acyl-CoA dehydrogenase